jgi:hypothetical protein
MSAPTHPTQPQPQPQPPQPTQQPPAWQPPPPGWGQATNPIQPPRPKRRRRRIILVAVGVGLALLIVGGVAGGGDPSSNSGPASNAAAPAPEDKPEPEGKAESSPEAEGPTQLAEGDSGVTHDVLGKPTARITVRNVREVRDPYDMVTGRWVVADVEVTALADNILTPDIYVLDGKGTKYTESYMAPDGTRYLDFTDLQAGQSASGVVAFELPTAHGRLVVPHSDGEPQLVWKF